MLGLLVLWYREINICYNERMVLIIMNILGFFDKLGSTLAENNGAYYVVDRNARKILYKGTEEECTKMFIMMCAGFIPKG